MTRALWLKPTTFQFDSSFLSTLLSLQGFASLWSLCLFANFDKVLLGEFARRQRRQSNESNKELRNKRSCEGWAKKNSPKKMGRRFILLPQFRFRWKSETGISIDWLFDKFQSGKDVFPADSKSKMLPLWPQYNGFEKNSIMTKLCCRGKTLKFLKVERKKA